VNKPFDQARPISLCALGERLRVTPTGKRFGKYKNTACPASYVLCQARLFQRSFLRIIGRGLSVRCVILA
ncbi:MAG: hypothetical protein LBU85_11725, partial [Treponema sp.]|nr:hypothetical protein [Treponema sp.]